MAVAAIGAWLVAESFSAHPDYLSYFNEAVRDPSYFLAESDLDWGQDLARLSIKLHELGIDHLSLAYFGNADPPQFDLPPWQPLPPFTPVHGWVAISVHHLLITSAATGGGYAWLAAYRPVARVGKSIRIYLI